MDDRRVDDANANLRTAFVALAEHGETGVTRTFGSIEVAYVGVPIPMFNRLFVFTPPSREDLVAAVDWMAGKDVPFWVTVPDSVLERFERTVTEADGTLRLVKAGQPHPGMVLASLEGIGESEPDLDVEMVVDAGGLDDFVAVSSAAFDIPSDVGRRLTPPAILTDDRIEAFLGRVEDQPVACGLLIRTDDVAGVYTIGVEEPFRRRGYGAAITRAVLEAGRRRGCTVGVLQASAMGYPVYEKMGFETTVEYHQFTLDL